MMCVCVCVCVCWSHVSSANTAEPIEMPCVELTHVGQRNHVLDGVQIPTGKGSFEGEMCWRAIWPFAKLLSTLILLLFVSSFIRYCGQGSSLLWPPGLRPYVGPMC